MDLKKSSITADILNILSDCKVHTLQEIADEVEVHKNTVYNHIQSLIYRYPIQTFSGGINRGGVYLEKNYVYQGRVLTHDELQVINKALTMLQNSEETGVDPNVVKGLLTRFSIPKSEDRNEERVTERTTC